MGYQSVVERLRAWIPTPGQPPATVSIGEQIDDVRRGLAATKRLASTLAKSPTNEAAISVPEICAVNFLLTYDRNAVRRIAELGTYTGHTANILADLSSPDTTIEIYDFFEHNETSRTHLRDHPAYDSGDFFRVWQHNTRQHQSKFVIHRGDLNVTKSHSTEPLGLLFVDIVKHSSLVNTVVDPFYDRLQVGGYLMHQDYYHWQSPWLVYQMERLDQAFELVGDFGNNMSVYVKRRELTPSERDFDYVNGLDHAEKYRLFDQAINRYPGLRAGNLKASKLRLSLEDPDFDSESLQREILEEFGDNERISGYACEVMRRKDDIADMMW